MLEDHPKENHIKSSFFSRPPQYQLEVNSVYRPKFSNMMSGKPFNKPFYRREEKQAHSPPNENMISESLVEQVQESQESTGSIATPEQPSDTTAVVSNEAQNPPNDPEQPRENVLDKSQPTEPTKSKEINEKPTGESESQTKHPKRAHSGKSSTSKAASSDQVKKNGPASTRVSEPTATQLVEPVKAPSTNHINSAPMELSSSVYVPPFPPAPPIIMSHNVTAFPPTPMNALVNPMLAPPVFSPGQPLKSFHKSKNKHLENMQQPVFQDIGLPSFGIPQNGTNKEYYVMVHVDAGATFSIRTGDQEQQIPGLCIR